MILGKPFVSVLEQDFPASDRTPEIVRKFEPRVRLLRKENGGPASAFNAGIPECSGEIVAFLDGDDWWESRKLGVVVNEFATYPEIGTVGHGLYEVDEQGRRLFVNVPDRRYSCRFSNLQEARQFVELRPFPERFLSAWFHCPGRCLSRPTNSLPR